jgi:Secretion system C-terminal sorting domain
MTLKVLLKYLNLTHMNKFLTLWCCLCFAYISSRAQLLPSIGLNAIPNLTDSICPIIPTSSGGSVPGITAGDTVPDFKLYTLSGDSVQLSQVLLQGLPVLLISSSYTCPVFRGKIPSINTVDSIYQGQLQVYIIYTVEAHPDIDVSPYSGNVWTTSANITEGVLYRQPTTYGERMAVADSLLNHYYVRPDILIDGPCNEWWLNYGTEPNSATLIKTDGTVFAFQQWFNKTPDNIFCEIDSLLGTNSGYCNSFANNGTFSFITDTIEYGLPNDVLAIHGTLTNLSSSANVVIDVQKGTPQMPASWQTALCSDVCYPPTVNQIQITIPPSGTQAFTFYFYTDAIPAAGMIPVRFRNANQTSNQYIVRYHGNTMSTGIGDVLNPSTAYLLFPNPTSSHITLHQTGQFDEVKITDVMGKFILHQSLDNESRIWLDDLPKGVYLLQFSGRESKIHRVVKQ